MDYWKDLDVTVYENWEDFCKRNPGAKIYYATTKDVMCIRMSIMNRTVSLCSEKRVQEFGRNLKGESGYLCAYSDDRETRSLNLSNSVAIVLYEALRQNDFDHMKLEGQLHRLSWDD